MISFVLTYVMLLTKIRKARLGLLSPSKVQPTLWFEIYGTHSTNK